MNSVGQNKRIETIRRALTNMPKRAEYLVLLMSSGDTPLQLREWVRDEVCDSLAGDIEAIVIENAEAAGIHESRFTLSYQDEHRNRVQETGVRHRPGTVEAGSEVTTLMLDGSVTSQLAQMQLANQHHQYIMREQFKFAGEAQRAALAGSQTATSAMRYALDTLQERHADVITQLREAHSRITELEQVNAELLAAVTTLQNAPEKQPPNSAAAERMVSMVERVGTLALMRSVPPAAEGAGK